MSADRKLRDFVNMIMAPLKNRVMMLIGRAVLEAIRDDTGVQTARLSLLKGEVRDGVERFQEWGFTSTPLPGAEAVLVFPFGNREHGLIVAVDDRRSRPKNVPAGGAAIYSADPSTKALKQIVRVLPDGTIELGQGTLEKIVNGESFKTLFNSHTHTGNLAVQTSVPTQQMGSSHISSKVKAVT